MMGVVFAKELRENLRARRVVLTTLLLGPLAAPLLFVAIIWFTFQQALDRTDTAPELALAGAEHAPNLVAWLQRQGVAIESAPDDPEAAVRSGELEVVIRIPAGFGEAWQAGRPAPVELLADRSRRYADTSVEQARRLLEGYSRQMGELRLQLRGVSPQVAQPLGIRTLDLSTPESRGGLLLAFLPYVVMITVFIGAMHMAIDTTSGERERRSLEPLLINPVPRWQIMLGKLLATGTFALATLGLGLIAFSLALQLLPDSRMDMALRLTPAVVALIFLLMIPVAWIAAALLTILAAFARSYREAQSYMGLVLFVPMVPSFWIFLAPGALEGWMAAVPLLGQSMLILELVRGEGLALLPALTTMLVTSLLAALLTAVAASLYERPGLIFGD